MTVKYQCPKCGRRFADWGAEKLGYRCPKDANCPANVSDDEIKLVRVGSPVDEAAAAPSLKRKPKVKEVKAVDLAEEEAEPDLAISDDEEEEDEEDDEEEEEEVSVGTPKKKAIVVDEDADETDADEEDSDEEDVADLDFEGDSPDAEVYEPET